MEYLKNEQFTNYMSVFSTDIIYKLLMIKKDKEVTSRTVDFLNRLKTANDTKVSFQQLENDLIKEGKSKIEPFDAIVYRLSNPFMEMGIDVIPYEKEMTWPIDEKMIKVLLILKWISSRNRAARSKGLDTPGITQSDLDSLQINVKLESLVKVLELLKTNLNYNYDKDTLYVNLYGNLNVPYTEANTGLIKYNMTNCENLIENIYKNLTR